MPMYDVGYRKWSGRLTPQLSRWWTIARSGAAITMRNQWIKRMLLAAWVPILGMGLFVFIFERLLEARQETLEKGMQLAGVEDVDNLPPGWENALNADRRNRMIGDLAKNLRQELASEQPQLQRKLFIWSTVVAWLAPDQMDVVRRLAAERGIDIDDEQQRMEKLDELLSIVEERAAAGDLVDEQALFSRPVEEELPPVIQILPYREAIIRAYLSPDIEVARRTAWAYVLAAFLSGPQGLATVILLSLIVPPLISRDLRSRAYFLYFSKPIGRVEYLLGKLAIPALFLLLITTLPAMCLFVFALLLSSPDIAALLDTWDLPLRILACSTIMIVPTISVALMFSSLTEESRFATFAWYAMWVLTAGAYFVMWSVNAGMQLDNNEVDSLDDLQPLNPGWQLLSLYHTVQNIQAWIFGLQPYDYSVGLGLLLIVGLTLGSWVIMYRRVSAPVSV